MIGLAEEASRGGGGSSPLKRHDDDGTDLVAFLGELGRLCPVLSALWLGPPDRSDPTTPDQHTVSDSFSPPMAAASRPDGVDGAGQLFVSFYEGFDGDGHSWCDGEAAGTTASEMAHPVGAHCLPPAAQPRHLPLTLWPLHDTDHAASSMHGSCEKDTKTRYRTLDSPDGYDDYEHHDDCEDVDNEDEPDPMTMGVLFERSPDAGPPVTWTRPRPTGEETKATETEHRHTHNPSMAAFAPLTSFPFQAWPRSLASSHSLLGGDSWTLLADDLSARSCSGLSAPSPS